MMLLKGFTLIEIMISMAIFLLVILTLGDLFVQHEHSFLQISDRLHAQRLVGVILDAVTRRIRPATFVYDGSSTVAACTGIADSGNATLLFPPPQYCVPTIVNSEEHYVTLATVPVPNPTVVGNLLTIQFYRPPAATGGAIYYYYGVRQAPPPSASPLRIFGSDKSAPIQDVEMWWTGGWVVVRATVGVDFGYYVQNSAVAFIRYYN